MSLLPILEVPNPVLKKKCVPVAGIDERIERLLDDMLETMYDAPGIGLAAPQVGITERVVVIDVSEDKNQPLKLVNPELAWTSDDRVTHEEGCLSLPKQFADVKRPSKVKLRYMDESGQARELDADGLLSRCIQHELDHLEGILFTDHISALKRNMIMRKLAKQRRLEG